jgi:hypothetical protein
VYVQRAASGLIGKDSAVVAVELMTGRDLYELETTIANGFTKFLEVGNALLEIQARKLYQDDGYATFEQYCAKRWSISRAQAYRMIQAAEVVEHLRVDPDVPLPIHEAQTRVLARLKEPEAIRAVWEEVVDEYGETVSAPKVRDAADYYEALQAHPHRASWPRTEVIAAYREEQKRATAAPPMPVDADADADTVDSFATPVSIKEERDDAPPQLSMRDLQHRISAGRQLLALEPDAWASLMDDIAVSEMAALVADLRSWCDAMEAVLGGAPGG